MKSVIFDLDGTLADTSGDLIAAANSCFRSLGHPDMLDPEQDKLTAFQGGRAMLRLGLERVAGGEADEQWVDSQYPLLLDSYEGAIDRFTVIYPGAVAALESLQSQDWQLGICTNKPEALARLLLERLNLLHYFDALAGADTLTVRKPDPAPLNFTIERLGSEPSRSLLVGDTESDIATARAARVPSVLVTFGPVDPAKVKMQPDALLHSYDELPELAARLAG